MKPTSPRKLGTLLAAGCLAASIGAAQADPVQLIFNIFIPPQVPVHHQGLARWAEQVVADSNGTLSISIPSASLAPVPQLWDAVEDGLVDIALVVNAFKAHQITLPTILTLPLVDGNAEAVSRAWWETFEADFAAAGEYGDFLPLGGFTTNGPHIMATSRHVTTPQDLVGLKVRVEGAEQVQIFQNLGATPVGQTGMNSFEMLTGGIVDAGLSPFGSALAQGQLGVTNQITTFPGGFARSGFTIVMRRDRFDSLPPEAQEAILANSGVELAARLGAIVDGEEAAARAAFEAGGATITEASAELVAAVEEASAFIREAWIARANARGLDGEAVLARYLERVRDAR